MSAILLKTLKFSNKCQQFKLFSCSAVMNHWNKDYKPNPHPPRTEEERIAAAEKYNLFPSEYKTYPDDGTGYGDYPLIPAESGDSRDPFYPWDMPELKRNFNEVLHVDADIIGEDRCDVTTRTRKSKTRYLMEFLLTVLGAFLIFYWCEDKKQFLPLLPKQYPGDGKVHYIFEKKQ